VVMEDVNMFIVEACGQYEQTLLLLQQKMKWCQNRELKDKHRNSTEGKNNKILALFSIW
jgi:hypothetical protein